MTEPSTNPQPPTEPRFLQLTFDGGRFASHTAPIDVLTEFTVAQQLFLKVARHLYFDQNPERKRLPRGFIEAAQLHLAGSEANCFTANLVRPGSEITSDTAQLFGTARDVSIDALTAVSKNEEIPDRFPASALDLLAAWGKRLEVNEALIVRSVDSMSRERIARIDRTSRERLALMIQRPLERVESIDGEVEELDDANSRCVLRTRAGERVELWFNITQRAIVLEALSQRPLTRLRARGPLSGGPTPKMKEPEELEAVDDDRAPEAQKVWDRLESFERIADGWLEGQGAPPTQMAVSVARAVLARLLIVHRELARPRVFPMLTGGVQAEWVIGRWAADVSFDPLDGSVEADATNGDSGEEASARFNGKDAPAEIVEPLALWLDALH